jgi:hypothetical protein
MFDTPPTGVTLLSFSLPIVGISLTPTTGSDVSIYSPATVVPTEVTRLQTDSALIVAGVSVAAGTYTSINVTISAPSGIFINTSGSTVGACANGLVCGLVNGAATTVKVPISLTLTSGQNQWIGLNVKLNNAIVTTGGIGIDFTQANVFSATTATRTGIPSGAVDTIEDFVGTVTAFSSGSSITVKSGISGQTVTAVLTSNTEYDTPTTYGNCPGAASACIKVGSTVSIDALLASSGTLTASEVDVLDATAVDEVEGVIYPTATANVFGLILADKVSSTGNTVLASATYGSGILLNVAAANPFVDTKTLSNTGLSPVFTVGGLLAGQVIRAQVSNLASTSNGITATAGNILLRWSRLTGAPSLSAGSNFDFTPPSYISTLDTGLVPPLLAYTYVNNTAFDGITDATGIAGASTVSIRALFLNSTQPTFAVAKVRVP